MWPRREDVTLKFLKKVGSAYGGKGGKERGEEMAASEEDRKKVIPTQKGSVPNRGNPSKLGSIFGS